MLYATDLGPNARDFGTVYDEGRMALPAHLFDDLTSHVGALGSLVSRDGCWTA